MRRRHRAIGPPTAAQQAYQDALRATGCAMCLAMGLRRACGHVRIHHRTTGDLHGQLQLGQWDVVALGDWHHQGVPLEGETVASMKLKFGPSLHHHKREFMEWIQDNLGERSTAALQEFQNQMISSGLIPK